MSEVECHFLDGDKLYTFTTAKALRFVESASLQPLPVPVPSSPAQPHSSAQSVALTFDFDRMVLLCERIVSSGGLAGAGAISASARVGNVNARSHHECDLVRRPALLPLVAHSHSF